MDETKDKKKKLDNNAMYGVFNEDIDDMPDFEPDGDDTTPLNNGEKVNIGDFAFNLPGDNKDNNPENVTISENDVKFLIGMTLDGVVENAVSKIAELVFFTSIKEKHPDVFEECHKLAEDTVRAMNPVELAYMTKIFNDNPGNARAHPIDAIEAMRKARKAGL